MQQQLNEYSLLRTIHFHKTAYCLIHFFYALGQEIFLRPPLTKTTEFEVKNRCKSPKEAKAEHLLQLFCSFLSDNKTHLTLELNSTKL